MKNTIILFAVAALLFSGCGKKSQEHAHDGEDAHEHAADTHQHEDGSVHNDHKDGEHSQEEFKVDSTTIKEHGHSHEDSTHKH